MNNQFNNYPSGGNRGALSFNSSNDGNRGALSFNSSNDGNPFNQFTSSTPYMVQTMQNGRNLTNFNEGYAHPNQIIEKTNFMNQGYVLHNNLHDNLLAEHIVEHYINIDSDDRKIETYPDPFNYVVTFKSLGKTLYKSFKRKGNDFSKDDEAEIPETPGPVIMRPFKNVKFVKLDHVVLSRYNGNRYTLEQNIVVDSKNNKVTIENIYLNKHCHKQDKGNGCYLCRSKDISCSNFCECNCKGCNLHTKCTKCFQNTKPVNQKNSASENTPETCICKSDERCHTCGELTCRCSMNDRYKFLILKVKELKNNRMYSTNTATADNTFILHVDRSIGNFHNVWITRFGTCTFPNSLLFNLERLSIEFYNNKGERLRIGVILQCNIKINGIHHKICMIFGKVDDSVKNSISGAKLELPISELCNIKSWYKTMFNNILLHISDSDIKSTLNNNYDTLFGSVDRLDIDDLIKRDITNNVFFIIGVVQNELNTLTKYED